MAKRRKVGNLLALSLLSLLAQQPMYPYEMAQTLRARGKDKNFKINWGSLYTVVNNLEKYGFVEEAGTVRDGRQPERTTYQITAQGLAELRDWLAELLSVPEDENSGVRHGAVRGRHPAARGGGSSCSRSGWRPWTGTTRPTRRT